MSVHPIIFPSITPTTLPSDAPSEKPSYNPTIHTLQAPTGFQVWFYLFKIVNSQPMFQVCNQALDQLVGLLI